MISQVDPAVKNHTNAKSNGTHHSFNPEREQENIMEIRDLILLNVRAIVDEPEKVQIETMPSEEATTFRVQVAPHDLGKAIGKQGRLANALRALIKAAATKNGYRVYLEVV